MVETATKVESGKAAASEQKRPDRNTMEGMIWNANGILQQALDAGTRPELFEKAYGLALLSLYQIGFAYGFSCGTGILLRRLDDGSWSKPAACDVSGLGVGTYGVSRKDVLVFINDEKTFESFTAQRGLQMGLGAELTVGTHGRSAKLDGNVSGLGAGPVFSISFSKGLCFSMSVEGAVLTSRNNVNKLFYQTSAADTDKDHLFGARDILYRDAVQLPADKDLTVLHQVYTKLSQLSSPSEDGSPKNLGVPVFQSMLEKVNTVLDHALQAGALGLPQQAFHHLVGIAILTVIRGGFAAGTGFMGTGILLRKRNGNDDLPTSNNKRQWSKPCACGVTGAGMGLSLGASLKEQIIFVYSESAMTALMAETGFKLGAQAELTLGLTGREAGLNATISHDALGATFSVAYSKDLLVGVSMEGAVIGPRNAVNQRFYGKELYLQQILDDDDDLELPPGDYISTLNDVYSKLDTLVQGRPASQNVGVSANAEDKV